MAQTVEIDMSSCGCCSGGIACCDCDATPDQWTLPVSGITNDGNPLPSCQTCSGYNSTWTLTRRPTDLCVWDSATGPCTAGPAWILDCDATDWVLQTPTFNGQAAIYKKSKATWNCLGSNTLNRISTSTLIGHCASWPATLTVTPV